MVNLRFGATSLLSLASVASLGAAERKDVSAWGRDQERPHPSIPWKNPLNDHIYLSKLIVQMDQEIQGTQVTIGPEIVQFQVQTIGGDGDKNEFARVFCRMPLDCTVSDVRVCSGSALILALRTWSAGIRMVTCARADLYHRPTRPIRQAGWSTTKQERTSRVSDRIQ